MFAVPSHEMAGVLLLLSLVVKTTTSRFQPPYIREFIQKSVELRLLDFGDTGWEMLKSWCTIDGTRRQ